MTSPGQNLFRMFRLDQTAGETTPAGIVCDMELPAGQNWRRCWWYFNNGNQRTVAGFRAEVIFYRGGIELVNLPLQVNTIGGFDVHGVAVDYQSGYYQIRAAVPGALYWDSIAANGSPFVLPPFDLMLETDRVRIHQNLAGQVSCLLSVLSGSTK